jgi:hypothetical protein
MTHDALHDWIAKYGRAWRERDAAAAALLFTENALYDSHPFRPPHHGREGVRAYWEGATRGQRDLELRFGRALLDGQYAAVEWWAIMEEEGEGTTTLPGCLFLRFSMDMLCEELREYWASETKRINPRANWGM